MYSTKLDILNYCSDDELSQLTSEQGDFVDDTVVNKAITDADGEIDSYLAVKYSVPLAPVPAIVNQLSSKIALYNLYSRRAGKIGMNETVENNYNNSVKFLQRVADGSVSIGVDPPPSASAGAVKVSFTDSKRTFTNKSMSGY